MLNLLIDFVRDLARKYEIGKVILVSDADIEFDDIEVIKAPRSYIEAVKNTFAVTSSCGLTESIMTIPGISEFVEAYLEARGYDSKAIVCVYLPNLKGAFVIDGESKLSRILKECSEYVHPEALRSALGVALTIAFKGREGKKIGTAFVIGDPENVLRRSRQIVINPYEGHPPEKRDVKNPDNWESIMEFAQLDGVFVLDSNGIILSAGRYLDIEGEISLKYGLGGRHIACASITKSTKSIAIVVSGSGGDITIFKDGEAVIEIPVSMM
ncbi:DNA integrity scanning protein DisA nucleotide-binding domain protein [Geoglobus acetivorans]|uniref:Diadenylate cyclase n=1 Tax=Geoglobus acetivorans TaxID=565033 RepID=A0A0A7GJ02_GEOAI|nr:hypothetical protein GACE_1901 [Geoglobus acetivorans]